MSPFRIALANLLFPASPDASVAAAEDAIAGAGRERAEIICFPECFVPGYRLMGKRVPPPDTGFLAQAWMRIGKAAATAHVAVVLGSERIVNDRLLISTVVFDHQGRTLGFQDKVQLDPSEESTFSAGSERQMFTVGALTFGVSICHEGWRYPETVRWAATRGAQLVFHPHFHEADA